MLVDDLKHQFIQFLIGKHPRLQKPYGIRQVLEGKLLEQKLQYTQ